MRKYKWLSQPTIFLIALTALGALVTQKALVDVPPHAGDAKARMIGVALYWAFAIFIVIRIFILRYKDRVGL